MKYDQAILQKNYGKIYASDTNVNWAYEKSFAKSFIKSNNFGRKRLDKAMDEILKHPERQPYLHADRDGQEKRVGSSRLYFDYSKEENLVTFTEFSHKDNQ